jgi:transposase InsO family protein
MHSLTKLTPLIRKEIYSKYKEKMTTTKWKKKEELYKELATFYRVHYNLIRKVIKRGKNWDFTIHKSTTRANLGHCFKKYTKAERKLLKALKRESEIVRYEKEMAGELVHIDVHKQKNIKWENPKKKKYWAWAIDDATRIAYAEVLPNKRAKTLADFIRRAHKWFELKGITIKKLLSDNGLEFTTHHKESRHLHSFEIALQKLRIIHKYTRVRRPQTNGKIERFWKIINDNFFSKHTFTSNKDFNMKFKDWLVFYNLKRPHGGIKKLTPMQKLEKLLEQGLVCL